MMMILSRDAFIRGRIDKAEALPVCKPQRSDESPASASWRGFFRQGMSPL